MISPSASILIMAIAYYNRGYAKSLLEQHFAAIADYDIAIRLNPDYADAYNNRGYVKSLLEQHFAAIADYDIAIRLKPDDAIVYKNRGLDEERPRSTLRRHRRL